MAIYRGPGGSGDAVNDSSSETRLAVEARDAALAAQAAAEAAQAAAETAETNAETAETNAETAETNAETAATNAASSASSASSSASAASTSATNAASSASSASTSATNAASSASSASTSASNASTSATNAASSATTASTAATNASNSATSAASSASTATTKASEASTSATNAASSASSASSSASTATTQAGIATTKASEASTSATNAASSASSASTSATNAASSASSASTSATNAASSATAASSAQSAAEAARDAALSAYDNFDDRYLGPKASDPTLDNDGNALVAGALYFNTTTNVMKVYTGSSWVAAYVSAAGVLLAVNNLSDLNSVSTARTNLGVTATGADTTYAYRTNNLSDLANAATARTNLGVAIGSNVQAWDADLDAIAALAGTSGLLKKTAANTWSLDTTTYLSGTVGVANGGTGLTSLTAGYIPFGAGTSAFGSSANLFWDSTNGRLGLGTASPSYRLDVYGASSDVARIYYPASGVQTSKLWFGTLSNATQAYVAATTLSASTGTLEFGTGATERMRIDSSGNVLVGTTSAIAKLASYAADGGSYQFGIAGTTKGVRFTTNSTTSQITGVDNTLSASYQPLQIGGSYLTFAYSGTTEGMRLDSSGNLGLGVTPSAWGSGYVALQSKAGGFALSYDNSSNNQFRLSSNAYYNGTAWTYFGSQTATSYEQLNGVHKWFNAPSGTAGTAITFTQAMTLNASGSLGIGTSSPARTLDVNGAVRVADGTVVEWGGVSCAINGSSSTNTMIFNTASSERMRITSTGNVGIGTSSPSNAKLVVSGAATGAIMSVDTASTTSFVRILGDISSQNLINWQAGTALRFATSNQDYSSFTERMRLDSSGNLGLGVTPSAWSGGKALQIYDASFTSLNTNDTEILTNAYYNLGFKYYGTGLASRYVQTSGTHSWHTAGSGTAGNAITFTQAMTLDASGRLGIGQTSPSTALSFADTAGTAGDPNKICLYASVGTPLYGFGISPNQLDYVSGGSHVFYSRSGSTSTERMRINSSGNLLVGTTSGTSRLSIAGTSGLEHTYTGATQPLLLAQFNSTGDASLNNQANAALLFGTNNTERMRIDSSGNVGIGANITASAAGGGLSFTVGSGTGNPAMTLYSATTGASQISFADATSGTGAYDGYVLYNQASQYMAFGTAATERMRIDSSGNALFAKAVRATITTDNDLSFDMNAASNFKCTPTAGGALTFTNITSGQTGNIILVNGSNYAITAAATTKVSATCLATISATGTYWLSYYSDGTNVYVANTGALA